MTRNFGLIIFLLATFGVGAYFFNTYNAVHKMSSNIPDSISIQVGEAAMSFVKRYPFLKIQKQPAGMNFYDIDVDSTDKNKRAIVKIENGKYSFDIPEVLSILGSENLSYPQEGIHKFNLYAGM
jgi:flavoprotein